MDISMDTSIDMIGYISVDIYTDISLDISMDISMYIYIPGDIHG